MYRPRSTRTLSHAMRVAGLLQDAENAALAAAAQDLHRRSKSGLDPSVRRLRVSWRWLQYSEDSGSKPPRLLLKLRLTNGRQYRCAWLWRAHEDQLCGFWERVEYTKVVTAARVSKPRPGLAPGHKYLRAST